MLVDTLNFLGYNKDNEKAQQVQEDTDTHTPHKMCERTQGGVLMTEQAKEARRAYKREWAKNNPEKVKASQERYWQRRAERHAAEQQTSESGRA